MYDFVYDEGHVVAHIKLGSIYTEKTNIKIATVSEGKIYSLGGQLVGYLKNANNMATDKMLPPAFRNLLLAGA